MVTQVFRVVTGISARFGLLGGENSEFRKTLRFFDPGNHRCPSALIESVDVGW